jgi:hypothetical protein
MRLLRMGGIAVALVAAIAFLAQSSAFAAPGGAGLVFAGTGTISPGLTTTPTFTSVTLSGTAAGFGIALPGAAAGTYNCSFSGGSTIAETTVQAQGSLSGTCGGAGILGTSGWDCEIVYVRVGSIWEWVWVCNTTVTGPLPTRTTDSVTGSGTASVTGGGVAVWTPDQAIGAVTSYKLVGVVGLAGAS